MGNKEKVYFGGAPWRGGRGFRFYRYTLHDIATAKGISIHAVRKQVYRGRLNPNDLLSVCKYLLSQDCRENIGNNGEKRGK